MRRIIRFSMSFVIFGLAVLAMNRQTACADHPLSGNWKVTVLSGGNEVSVWIIKVAEKEGKFSADVVASGPPAFRSTKIESVKVEDSSIHLTMNLRDNVLYISGYAPAGQKKPKKLTGSILIGSSGGEPARWLRTDDKKIDKKKIIQEASGAKEFNKLKQEPELKNRVKILEFLLKKYADEPIAIQTAVVLMSFTADEAAKDKLNRIAHKAVKLASKYGPEMTAVTAKEAAGILLKSKNASELALPYAKIAKKNLSPAIPTAEQHSTLSVYLDALHQAKKVDEAKQIRAKLAKLDRKLDEEFAKNAIPFEPKEFPGRKMESKRVTVVELFTGAQCPPCVAADVAFDAMLKTYTPKDVLLLQYHLHVPLPDPLTNKGTEKRAEYYDYGGYTPAMFINGEKGPAVGGPKGFAEGRYKEVTAQVEKALEKNAEAKLQLEVSRNGNTVALSATPSELPKNAKNIRLRFVLLEELVRYAGTNKQRLHHHVARAFPGGVDGFKVAGKNAPIKASVDLRKLKISLLDYLDEYQKTSKFPFLRIPMELDGLIVVALLQDDETKEILNAVQMRVPEGKE